MAEVDVNESDADGGAAEADWRQAAAEGARDPDRVRKHLEGFADIAGLADAYVEARTAISSGRFKDKTVIPAEDAGAEAWQSFWEQMPEGMRPPAAATDYSLPEGVEALDAQGEGRLSRFLEAMHQSGASQGVVQAALATYFDLANEANEGLAAEEARARDDAEAELRRGWGRDYDKNVELANRFLTVAFGEGADFIGQKLADGTPLGSHPVFVQMAARMGRALGEDEMVGGGGGDGARSLQEQIDEITEQAQKDGTYYDARTQTRLRPLYERLHGTEPADGRTP